MSPRRRGPWLHSAPATALFDPAGLLSKEACQALFDKIVSLTTGGGDTAVHIDSSSQGAAEWGLNRMRVASDVRSARVDIVRYIHGTRGSASVTRLDEDGLRTAVETAEEALLLQETAAEVQNDPYVDQPTLQPVLWDAATYGVGANGCTDLAQQLIAPAEAAGMVSTGAFRVRADGTAVLDTYGMFRYYPTTAVECSMTVRDTVGSASGWAGVNHYALSKIDPPALAAKALEKAQQSAHPVAVEPGRYTAILEPQAMADLLAPLFTSPYEPLARSLAEQPGGPFGLSQGQSKITKKVLDDRLRLRVDPMDPDGGFLPFDGGGTPYQAVNLVDQGILKDLFYSREYALRALGSDQAMPNPKSFRLTAAPGVATATIDEMIAKTERGVLVTRFSSVGLIDLNSMLCTGYTRDGLWLIEHGKVTKPIKNFRFNESPLFILNNLEEIGTPVRVFAPGAAYVAPAVRVRDFSFVALADAV